MVTVLGSVSAFRYLIKDLKVVANVGSSCFVGHSFIIFIGFVNYLTNNLDSKDPLCHDCTFAAVRWHTHTLWLSPAGQRQDGEIRLLRNVKA